MSRYYRIVHLLDDISRIEADLALETEYESLSLIPIIAYLFDRHCFYRKNIEYFNSCYAVAEDMLLEFDISRNSVTQALSELDLLVSKVIDAVSPSGYPYSMTHRYLHHYSFVIEIYVFDSIREQISPSRIIMDPKGDSYVQYIPPISAYGS